MFSSSIEGAKRWIVLGPLYFQPSEIGKFIYVVCVALRLARFNVSSEADPSWRDNFFEGIPSPAGGVLVLMPLIYSYSEFQIIKINYEIFVPTLFILNLSSGQ